MGAATVFACVLLTLVSTGTTEADVFINLRAGNDTPICLQGNFSCQTLGYVLANSSFLHHTEIVLEGHHWINHTLTVSGVEGLTIQGGGNTISCSDAGSGIVFESVSNLKVLNITFDGCGTLPSSTTRGYITDYSAVHIINSTNVEFSDTSFHRSVGRGLSMHSVDGRVEVSKSRFVENVFPPGGGGTGGGVYIELSSRVPGSGQETARHHNTGTWYSIKDCVFRGNRASTNNTGQRSVLSESEDGINTSGGGGIHFVVNNSNSTNSMMIQNCTFYNNSARYGGGMHVVFLGRVNNNSKFSIEDCSFTGNRANGGGAVQVEHSVVHNSAHNTVSVLNTIFTHNTAGWGGAVTFLSPRSSIDAQNRFELTNCLWTGNSASVGAAVLFTSTKRNKLTAAFPIVFIRACSFTRNTLLVLKRSSDGLPKLSGIVDVRGFELYASEKISFKQNKGSPVFAMVADINILQNTTVYFVNNTAKIGGGMTLVVFSIIQLYPGSQLLFESNEATELGGAIYAALSYQDGFLFHQKCFIHHHPGNYGHQDGPALVSFTNNTARYGESIYTDSLYPCRNQISGIGTSSIQWKGLKFSSGITDNTIATSPASIDFTLPPVAPGERFNLNLKSLDDLKQSIPTVYRVIIAAGGEGEARTSTYISDEGFLQIKGTPGTEFNLTLQTLNMRDVSATRTGRLGDCPLGLTLVDHECVCSASTRGKSLVGVAECDMSSFKAYLHAGYWIGCTPSNQVVTSLCPLGYCHYRNVSGKHKVDIPRSCDLLEELSVCVEHRRGELCGECEDGYSVYFHSEHFLCGDCPLGAAGLVFYLLSQLIPLLLLFAVIMAMKLKMTSGLMQSLLLFAHTVGFINITNSAAPPSKASHTLLRIHTFILGFLNLDFFRLDELSFCLWSGATVLDNLAFCYVSTLFAVLLLALFIFVVQKSSSFPVKCVKEKLKLGGKLTKCAGRINFFDHSTVHGISAVLILSYTQCTVVSFQIISHLPVYGEGEQQVRTVVRQQGNVENYGVDHLPYVLPALLVLIFLSLPPPLLLIAYPLLWNIRAKLRRNEDSSREETTPWLIRKLLPLIDSFQGVFRDSCRMFAGLLFLWRFFLAVIFACSPSPTLFFFLTGIALLVIFTIHVIARPYKRRLFNLIDTVMLANMAIINLLSWHISIASVEDLDSYVELEIAVKLVLMYAPLLVVAVFAVIWLLRRCSVMPEELQCQTTEEDDPIPTGHSLPGSLTPSAKKLRDTRVDEDLFSRASKLNTSSYVMTGSEAGFELKESTEITRETKHSETQSS